MAVFIPFFCMEVISSRDGLVSGSVITDGTVTYTCVVILVNLKILTNANTFTFFNYFFSIGSIVYLILNIWVLNYVSMDSLYREISSIFFNSQFYFALIFLSSALILVDNGLHLA